ncbi:MAG: hypothetical protein HC852_02745 [Acaryochloridaceae cyanobacterium RU_4_10]|nr:hypothetical protein [Acaryochloridaceae cyanobacterium RU_4_10]
MTHLTLEIPDQIAEQLETYLNEHHEENLSSLIQDFLAIRLMPKDGSKLLELAGIVTEVPRNTSEHAEDFEGS